MDSRARADRVILTGSHCVNSFYNRIITPILPLIVLDFGLNYAQAGLIISVYAIASSLFQLPISFAADYFGRRRAALALSLLVTGAPVLLYGLAGSYPVFLLLVFISGMGSSAYHPPAVSMLSALAPRQRTFSLGLFKAGGDVGNILAPAVVGLLAAYLGSWRAATPIFFLPGILFAWLVWARFTDPPVQRSSFRLEVKTTLREFLANRIFMCILVLSTMRSMSLRGLMTFLPLLLAEGFGYGPKGVGWILTCYFLLGSGSALGIGKLCETWSPAAFVVAMLGGSALGLFLLPWATSFPLFLGILAVLGLTLSPIQSLILAVVAGVVREKQSTSSVGMVYSVNEMAAAVSPFIGGLVAEAVGLRLSFLFYAVLCLLGTAMSAVVYRMLERPPALTPGRR